MTKDLYDGLSEKEKMMYDELTAFSRRLTERMTEIIVLLERILAA